MWTTLQDQSFLLGAALVILVHATKFGELNLGNPVANRYIALMPGAKVRDSSDRMPTTSRFSHF